MPLARIGTVSKVIEGAQKSASREKIPEDLESATCPHAAKLSAELKDIAKKLWELDAEAYSDTSKSLGLIHKPGGGALNFYDENALLKSLVDTFSRFGSDKALDELVQIMYNTLEERLRLVSNFSVESWKCDILSGMTFDKTPASMLGGITTSLKYIHGGAKLIDDLLPKGSANDKKALFDDLVSFFGYLATMHKDFEAPVVICMAEEDEEELIGMTVFPMVKFITSRFGVEYADGVPRLLVNDNPLTHMMEDMSKREYKNPSYGCSAYLAEILKPFLLWSSNVVDRYHFSLLQNQVEADKAINKGF